MKVPELMYAGERDTYVCIVHDRRSLIVRHGHHFDIEIEGPPAQHAVAEIEVLVQWTRVDDGDSRSNISSHIAKVNLGECIDPLIRRHRVDPRGVAVEGEALPLVIEVATFVGHAHGQAGDDLCRKLSRVGLPLLLRVPLDEGLVQGLPDQRDRLLLEI